MRPLRCRVPCRKALAIACASAAGSLTAPAAAQQDAIESRGTIKIEVTGSHIVRTDVETALPLQVITREDIERGGFTTVAGLMASISANVGAFNDVLSVGVQFAPGQIRRPALSSVNLRGIGDGSTLVLINGRRVANYAFDGGAVDVNAIPVSAIDRVEILKDGASAIYGTDAIAGVVNFILRKDFRGVEVTGYGGWTQQGGGDQYQATVSAGYGDLAADKFNAFVTVDYQKDQVLRATDREFSRTGYRPEDGLFQLTRWTFPANIIADRGRFVNPGFDTGCTPPSSFPQPLFGQTACGYDAQRFFDVLPQVSRTSILGRATFQSNPELQLFAEAAYAYSKFAFALPPTPAGGFLPDLFFYPEGGPFYPAAFASANGLSGDLNLLLRTSALGSRINDVETRALRLLLGADGSTLGWDYSAAIVYSENRQQDNFASGYVSSSRLTEALATGLVNPFGPSGPEGDALLQGTSISGDFHSAQGTTWLVDAKASRDLLRLPGGALAIGLGVEARHEKLDNTFSPLANSGDVLAAGGENLSVSNGRSAQAFFAEASVPFAPGFESQLAVRYDHYSDFGSTVNPKVALRWQPMQSLLLRTSWATGFRAPTIYDLYTPLQHTFTVDLLGDPVRCPVTSEGRDCLGEFPAVTGGNPKLKPETSNQFNAGVVFAPAAGLSLSLDYWKIDKKNIIFGLSEFDVLASGARFAANVVRGPVDPNYPDLPGPIELVVLQNENFGDLRTSGFDVGFKWRAPATSFGRFSFALDGTYISTFTVPDINGDLSFVGNNSFAYPIPRWRHYASVDWNYGPWSATLAQVYQNGYEEEDFRRCDDEGVCPRRRVGSYSVWNLQGQYTGLRNTTLTLGVRNLFGRDPPLALLQPGRQTGFDGSYADPRGRTFYARLTYAFK
jgi:iron complex outermembrane recepter protein